MNLDKPNFLSQPVVKNIFMYRNGDPYYEGRRLVINEKRVNNFEVFLKEVTGGIQAPYGAVRTIYTPKAGHRVSSLEHLQSGEQYVAAGKEKFKKLDYLHIGTKKKKMLQSNGQLKPVPQSRIIVSARFLKPIKEPCTIFIIGNGDVLNPAVRLLIPQRVMVQYERVLETITEKMGLRILGGVRSLYTLDGTVVTEGKDLENGQFYVAVGREKFKKLPYNELIFTKPVGMRRFIGSKAASLPPIYRFRKQNGNQVGRDQSKSMVSSSEAGDPKTSPPGQQNKDQLASIVSELSQARLMKLRQKKSCLTMTLGGQSNDDGEQGTGENGENPEAQADEGSKDDPSAEEACEENGETSEGPAAAAEASAGNVPDIAVNGAEEPTEDTDSDPPALPAGNGKEEKSEERNENSTPAPDRKEENEEKVDNSSPVPDGEETSEEKNDGPTPAPDRKEENDEKVSDPSPVPDGEEKGEEKNDSPTPALDRKEENDEKVDNSSTVPDGEEKGEEKNDSPTPAPDRKEENDEKVSDPSPVPDGEEKGEEENESPTPAADRKEDNDEKADDPSPVPDGNEKSEEKNDNSTPTPDGKGENEGKNDNPTSAPDGDEDEEKSEEEKQDGKPEDREPETEGQSGEGEVSGEGEEKSQPAEGAPTDQVEEGQESDKKDELEEEKSGSSTNTKKEPTEEDNSSDVAQRETENSKGEEESGGEDEGSEKEDGGKAEKQ